MKLPEKKLSIKLIATDMDDTLLDKNAQVPEKNQKALLDAAKKGIYVVLASGRIKYSLTEFSKKLGLDKIDTGKYIVALNGARIYDISTGETIYSKNVDGEILVKAFEEVQKMGYSAEVYGEKTIYTNLDNEWTRLDSGLCQIPMKEVPDFKEFLKKGHSKMLIPGKPEDLLILKERLEKVLGDKAEIFTSKPYFLEIMSAGCGKGEALEFLAKKLKIPIEQTMAFGDSMNDETMIQKIHNSVAMKNGLDYIKNIAKYVTRKTNEECGVADFINSFVL